MGLGCKLSRSLGRAGCKLPSKLALQRKGHAESRGENESREKGSSHHVEPEEVMEFGHGDQLGLEVMPGPSSGAAITWREASMCSRAGQGRRGGSVGSGLPCGIFLRRCNFGQQPLEFGDAHRTLDVFVL